jgi:predicted amidohydrolase
VRNIATLAAEMVVCLGYCEAGKDGARHTAAVCVSGDGVLGRHRKVYLSPAEAVLHTSGEGLRAFDTPAGRVSMMIDYDKTFPEAARGLAADGAEIVACLSAWATSSRSPGPARDRQARLFDLYDWVRAAENQVVFVSANQAGVMNGIRFLGQAKVVDPSGDIRARTGAKPAVVVAEFDVKAAIAAARLSRHHPQRAHTRALSRLIRALKGRRQWTTTSSPEMPSAPPGVTWPRRPASSPAPSASCTACSGTSRMPVPRKTWCRRPICGLSPLCRVIRAARPPACGCSPSRSGSPRITCAGRIAVPG